MAWDLPTYRKYFDGVHTQEDIKRIARVLSQSWGGFLLGLPMNLIMM